MSFMAKTAAKKTAGKTAPAKKTPEKAAAETPAAPKPQREASAKADKGVKTPSHEEISRRAYQLWEEAGRPHGQHETFWSHAERELRGLGPQQPAR